MALSLFLAQLLGLYFLIAGLVVLIRRQSIMGMMGDLARRRALLFVFCLIELAAGLALVIAHPIFTFDWQGIITFIGAWMVIEAVFFLAVPTKEAQRFIRSFNKRSWYVSGSLVAIALGAYLAGIGFGFF